MQEPEQEGTEIVEAVPASYFELSRDPWVSLVLVLPLLAIYQAGIMFTDFQVVSGVDFLTRYVYGVHGLQGVVVLNLSIVAVFLAAIIRLGRTGRFRTSLFIPLVVESTAYAALLGGSIVFVLKQANLLSVAGAQTTNVVLSVGAGVYEELVFRMLLIGVLVYVFRDFFELGNAMAIGLAVIVSSALFSAAHHMGPYGAPFNQTEFAFRLVAGLLFAVLYKLRSFAVAVYTHAFYDVYVLVVLPTVGA